MAGRERSARFSLRQLLLAVTLLAVALVMVRMLLVAAAPKIRFESDIDGSVVFADGSPIGTTPFTISRAQLMRILKVPADMEFVQWDWRTTQGGANLYYRGGSGLISVQVPPHHRDKYRVVNTPHGEMTRLNGFVHDNESVKFRFRGIDEEFTEMLSDGSIQRFHSNTLEPSRD